MESSGCGWTHTKQNIVCLSPTPNHRICERKNVHLEVTSVAITSQKDAGRPSSPLHPFRSFLLGLYRILRVSLRWTMLQKRSELYLCILNWLYFLPLLIWTPDFVDKTFPALRTTTKIQMFILLWVDVGRYFKKPLPWLVSWGIICQSECSLCFSQSRKAKFEGMI